MSVLLAAIVIATTSPAQGQRPIVLGPDDKAAVADAPTGFDSERPNQAKGKVETVEYDSKSVGTRRKMMVYLPPSFSRSERYPVLYLLHGIGGTEMEWVRSGAVAPIMDNLIADKKIAPMIVVMPNGRARPNDRAEGNVFESAPAFGEFDKDLLGSVIPHIDASFPTKPDRDHRALAGLSMGGGQTLNFGFANTDTFAYIGAFSSAPNTRPDSELFPATDKLKSLKFIWISCGDQDGLMGISQRVQRGLKERGVPHLWHVDKGGHTWPVWRNDLYHFAQRIFR